ncbi:hypothetical protein DPMN_073880 [Dreissena polymorpha]|uniref:Uncharacterized protein n=1 Tax=Dreissena polymorpha TaxID=45954 RepID=A0A9D3YGL8_DREPO|nr:hypothetical protein DPMN_073880 [Dreissena polymorpha]
MSITTQPMAIGTQPISISTQPMTTLNQYALNKCPHSTNVLNQSPVSTQPIASKHSTNVQKALNQSLNQFNQSLNQCPALYQCPQTLNQCPVSTKPMFSMHFTNQFPHFTNFQKAIKQFPEALNQSLNMKFTLNQLVTQPMSNKNSANLTDKHSTNVQSTLNQCPINTQPMSRRHFINF